MALRKRRIDESAAHEWTLKNCAGPSQRAEHRGTREHGERRLLLERQAVRGCQPPPILQDLSRQRDIDRTRCLAGIAGNAEALRTGVVLEAVMERRIDQTDCAAVDITKGVTSDRGVGGTGARACAASDAAQRIYESRGCPHSAAPIVQQHDMQLAVGLS